MHSSVGSMVISRGKKGEERTSSLPLLSPSFSYSLSVIGEEREAFR